MIKRDTITKFITDIKRRDGLPDDFDEELWYELTESVRVAVKGNFFQTGKRGKMRPANG